MDAGDTIYIGLWTNWSRGSVLGSTWTLNREHGNYVIALTAFYIAFVATRFWRISCFFLHRCFSSPTSAQTIHRQRQVILCNSSSPEAGLTSLVALFWSWRHLGLRCLYRLLLLILFVAICYSGFVVAGSYSSRISTDVGNEVLLRSDHCGSIRAPSKTASSLYNSLRSQKISKAMNYAEECYSSNNVSSMVECKGFIVPKLPTATTNHNAGCPFDDSICRSNDSNVLLDSGFIDSRDHLGLNLPDSQQFQLREVLHCAPLRTEGYEIVRTIADQSLVAYDYGGMIDGPMNNLTVGEYTYQIENVDSQYRGNTTTRPGVDLIVETEFSLTIQNQPSMSASFMPRKELQRPDGDIEIIFLSGNGVYFERKMADDWYRATVPAKNLTRISSDEIEKGYRFEIAASPLGCVRQWQWCNPSLPKDKSCGPLASYTDSYLQAAPLFGITDEEMEQTPETSRDPRGHALMWGHRTFSSNPMMLYEFLGTARSNFLSSTDRLYGAAMSGLPDNQWKLDVVHWWNTLLAEQQLSYISTARGPRDPEFDPMRELPVNDSEKVFCESQKVLSSAHTSFNMFGLCFTISTGGLIIAISYLLDPIFRYLHRRYRYRSYQNLEWRSNATLQIHRQAEEQIGSSTWENCTSAVPTSAEDDVLSSLDITNPNHPKLRAPPSRLSKLPLDDLYGEDADDKVDYTRSETTYANIDSAVSSSDGVEHSWDGTYAHFGTEPVVFAPHHEANSFDPAQAGPSSEASWTMDKSMKAHLGQPQGTSR